MLVCLCRVEPVLVAGGRSVIASPNCGFDSHPAGREEPRSRYRIRHAYIAMTWKVEK